LDTVILNLYSTSHCHLCEEAESLLINISNQQQIQWECIEIADDSNLLDRYALKIPVIKRIDIDTDINWPFGELDIKNLINLK
jgi:hypothetical protein